MRFSVAELRRRLALNPADPSAAVSHGSAALAAGNGRAANLWLGAAATLDPARSDLAGPLQDLAVALFSSGHPAPAARLWGRALKGAGGADAAIWNNYGVALDHLGRVHESGTAFRRAAALAPGGGAAFANLADLSFRAGGFAAALALARRAGPDAGALTTAANALLRLARPIAAAAQARRALCLAPDQVVGLTALATAALAVEDLATAGLWLPRALAVRPDDVGANNNLSTLHLTRGDLRRGFALYEWRWLRPESGRRREGLPEWRGEPLGGRTLLLYAEQGLGDALQMVRYAPLLARSGMRVIIECPPDLLRLFRSLPGDIGLCLPGEPVLADVQAAMMSLPWLCGTSLETLPSATPYLAAEPGLLRDLAPRFAAAGRHVGLVWQGNPRQVDEPHRSVPLACLAPMLGQSGVTFHALQKEYGREQMSALADPAALVDQGPALVDLATTAAMMTHLDLVISPCTATAHLAGALGRPVWILLKRAPDWRWMLDREDTPWYPTARLVRQRRPGDWSEVGMRLRDMMSKWLG
jgi:tetratricopeptide (TPR) repeat protein